MKYSKFCSFVVFSIFSFALFSSTAVKADLIYTIEGVANEFPDPNLSPEVGLLESFVAEFRIDSSVLDGDPSSDRGSYSGAIVASSIEFSGGYSSTVDFAGGELVVLQNSGGFGGISFSDLAGNGSILFGGVPPFATDAIPDDTNTVFSGPLTLISLTEPTGLVSSLSTFATPTLTISAVPEPSTIGLLAIGCVATLGRRRR